ncbi:MAG TPA: hypothetical protein PK771_02255 [Spirochaetota bacterium]|nr:hypothetical protein [Spirochaetota bacterium]
MKKFLLLPLIFFMIVLFSCHLDGMFEGDAVFNGNTAQFIKDGYSIPIVGAYDFKDWEIPEINNQKMFQIGRDYNIVFKLVNPGKLSLNYKITTDKPELFDTGVDVNIIASGVITEVKNDMKIPFKLKDIADKNNINFKMYLSSSMRSYEVPSINTIYVNNRPSKVIPKADAFGSEVKNNFWEPVVANNQTTIYWGYLPIKTDTDLSHITILYKVGGENKIERIDFDNTTKKFGNNSFTTDAIANEKIDFSINVYDIEGLESGNVSTGEFAPQRAGLPVFNRTGNVVTITPYYQTTLNYQIDDGEWNKSEEVVNFNLITTHKIVAYSSGNGLFDSERITMNYTANSSMTITFDKNPTYEKLDFSSSTKTVKVGETLTIAPNSTFNNASDWKWYVNDENTPLSTKDSFIFDAAGKLGDYIVNCFVKINGVYYSGSIKITIEN